MSIKTGGIGRKKIDRIAMMPMAKSTSRPLRRSALTGEIAETLMPLP